MKQKCLSFYLNWFQTQVGNVGTYLLGIQTPISLSPGTDRLVSTMSLEEFGATKQIDFACSLTGWRAEDLGDTCAWCLIKRAEVRVGAQEAERLIWAQIRHLVTNTVWLCFSMQARECISNLRVLSRRHFNLLHFAWVHIFVLLLFVFRVFFFPFYKVLL